MKQATQASLKECRISDVTTRLDLYPLRTIVHPLSSPSGTAREICKKLDKGDESAKSLTFIQCLLPARRLCLMHYVNDRHVKWLFLTKRGPSEAP